MKPTVEVPVELFKKLICIAETDSEPSSYSCASITNEQEISWAKKLIEEHKANQFLCTCGNPSRIQGLSYPPVCNDCGNPVYREKVKLKTAKIEEHQASRNNFGCLNPGTEIKGDSKIFEWPLIGATVTAHVHSVVTDEMVEKEAERFCTIWSGNPMLFAYKNEHEIIKSKWRAVAKAALSDRSESNS